MVGVQGGEVPVSGGGGGVYCFEHKQSKKVPCIARCLGTGIFYRGQHRVEILQGILKGFVTLRL